MQSSRRICHNPFYEIVDRSEAVLSSPPWLLHLRGVSYSLVHGLCTCCAVYSIVNVLMKEENLSFLLTLTKKAKNRRIKWNFIKNIFQAALIHGGYCLGHGLGLHLLLRQFHLAWCDFCSSDQRFASTFLQIPLTLIIATLWIGHPWSWLYPSRY